MIEILHTETHLLWFEGFGRYAFCVCIVDQTLYRTTTQKKDSKTIGAKKNSECKLLSMYSMGRSFAIKSFQCIQWEEVLQSNRFFFRPKSHQRRLATLAGSVELIAAHNAAKTARRFIAFPPMSWSTWDWCCETRIHWVQVKYMVLWIWFQEYWLLATCSFTQSKSILWTAIPIRRQISLPTR